MRERCNSLPNDKIFDWSKLKAFCILQNKCEWKVQIWFGKGRKHCGKKRKCWLPAFSPFHILFSKAIYFRVINPFPHNDTFGRLVEINLLKTLSEKEELLVTSNFSFSHSVFFSFFLDNFLPFSSNLKLSSANFFSLEESKICHMVTGLCDKGRQSKCLQGTVVV